MAIGIEGVKTWHHEPNLYNIKYMDAAVLSDGRIVVGFAGGDATGFDGYLGMGILNQATDKLTQVQSRRFDDAPGGGYGFTAVTELDLAAGPGGRLTAGVNLLESAVGDDVNGALLMQRFNGTSFLTAVAVDPSRTADTIAPATGLVFNADGSSAAFYTTSSTTDPSSGIYMARFAANGTAIGTPAIAIADHPAGGFIAMDANPIEVDAAGMTNGNIALVWTESSAFAAPTYGQPRVMFQAVNANGTALGTAVEVDGTSARAAQVVALTGGGVAVVWLDTTPGDQGIYKAQILSANGTKLGGVFELSSSISTQEYGLEVVALETGGFAATWTDVASQTHLARMFDAKGHATGADFRILDSDADFIGAKAGLIAKGDQLITYLHGLNGTVGSGYVVQGQTWSTANSYGLKYAGTAANNSKLGGAKDDILSGNGGNDTLTGNGGNDVLSGGAGRDVLDGGAGVDQLSGGAGADRLRGGTGADSFLFNAASEGSDRITDFNAAEGDRLIFFKAGFGNATGFASGASTDFAHVGLFFNTTNHTLSFDADGSGTGPRLLIATLDGVNSLAADDLLFV